MAVATSRRGLCLEPAPRGPRAPRRPPSPYPVEHLRRRLGHFALCTAAGLRAQQLIELWGSWRREGRPAPIEQALRDLASGRARPVFRQARPPHPRRASGEDGHQPPARDHSPGPEGNP